MMKRIVSLLLCLCVLLALGACGGAGERKLYKEAAAAFEAGDYATAKDLFEQLCAARRPSGESYKDAEARYAEVAAALDAQALAAALETGDLLAAYDVCRLSDSEACRAKAGAYYAAACVTCLNALLVQYGIPLADLRVESFEAQTLPDSGKISFCSDGFEALSDRQRSAFFELLDMQAFYHAVAENCAVRTPGGVYTFVREGGADGADALCLLRDGQEVFRQTAADALAESGGDRVPSDGTPCPLCGGTGYVRVSCGAGALEAALGGYGDHKLTECPHCG